MDIIKNISAVLGLIVTFGAVCALLSKSVRSALRTIFIKNGGEDIDKRIDELTSKQDSYTEKLDKHIEDDKIFRESMTSLNDVIMEFIRTQCRNTIKDTYNKYHDVQKLPYYEYKVLLSVEDLYVKKAHGNSFAVDMLTRMKTWDVDYSDCSQE